MQIEQNAKHLVGTVPACRYVSWLLDLAQLKDNLLYACVCITILTGRGCETFYQKHQIFGVCVA
jgi:hypothetical protein